MMREVPEHYQERVKELFGDECWFKYLPFIDRFCVTSRIPGDWESTCTLFVIETEDRKFRPINDSDLARIAKSRVFNDEEKEARMKKLAEINEKEKRDRSEAMRAEAKKKADVVKSIGKDLERNPILAQKFQAEAKMAFSTDIVTDETGKTSVVSKRRGRPKGSVIKKIK